MQLREAKQILRAALETASDEKLAEMLAWAQDGHMGWVDTCGCFAGSLLAFRLHRERDCEDPDSGRCGGYGGNYARWSMAYYHLGNDRSLPGNNRLRQLRIVPIIKAQMRIRELHRKDEREFTAMTAETR